MPGLRLTLCILKWSSTTSAAEYFRDKELLYLFRQANEAGGSQQSKLKTTSKLIKPSNKFSTESLPINFITLCNKVQEYIFFVGTAAYDKLTCKFTQQ